MPVHSDESCDNTDKYCAVDKDCDGCLYCCPDHMGCCPDCGCTEESIPDDCSEQGECQCHTDGLTDAQLRRAERRQMGIT